MAESPSCSRVVTRMHVLAGTAVQRASKASSRGHRVTLASVGERPHSLANSHTRGPTSSTPTPTSAPRWTCWSRPPGRTPPRCPRHRLSHLLHIPSQFPVRQSHLISGQRPGRRHGDRGPNAKYGIPLNDPSGQPVGSACEVHGVRCRILPDAKITHPASAAASIAVRPSSALIRSRLPGMGRVTWTTR